MAVLLLFFLSGATALIYEVLWSKHLALLLGSTVQAQTVVLAVFMGAKFAKAKKFMPSGLTATLAAATLIARCLLP